MSLLRRRGVIASAGFRPIVATGGASIVEFEQAGILYRAHLFTVTGSGDAFEVQDLGTSDGSVEWLVVAGGGGGGGGWRGGGGGAGGYRTNVVGDLSGASSPAEAASTVTVGTYAVTVGSGASSVTGARGVNGSPSSLVGTGISISAAGGGGGGIFDGIAGLAGGSGGGGGSANGAGGAGTAGQGTAGGGTSTNARGGGGGGAGTAGRSGVNTVGNRGNSGLGLESSILEPPFRLGGGGSGGAYDGGPPSINADGGGLGGWAPTSAFVATMPGGPGDPNTGGGGGGASGQGGSAIGGAGGSGIVIIRYPLVEV